MTTFQPIDAASGKQRAHWLLIVLAIAAGSTLLTLSMQASNPRILVSWHGFLHTAIANRFPGPFKTPENPFFAGESLPYYWLHQYVASLLGRAFSLHPIRVFQIISAASLVVLWISSGAIGVRRFRSLTAGLLVGYLALAGVNPLGPVIAAAKHVVQGEPLFGTNPPASAVETVFVTEHESSSLLTHPLLGALYFTRDWRRGQSLPWYLDNSSRGIAIALIFPLLFLFMDLTASWRGLIAAAAIAAVMTALNPLIGLACNGSLAAASLAVALFNAVRARTSLLRPPPATLRVAAAAAAGAALASPTYYHLFLVGGSSAEIQSPNGMLIRATALGLNVIALLPLALWSAAKAPDALRDQYRILVVAACALLLIVPPIELASGTEHNFANTAQALLVIPAVAATLMTRRPRRTALILVGLFLPMSLGTLARIWDGRPFPSHSMAP